MLINEVEAIVGLSKKSIRYYEEEGLIYPGRNKNNDYRIYTVSDVELLKVIKFLRELGMSVNDIRAIIKDEKLLQDCMREQMIKVDEQINDFNIIKNMCSEISQTNENIQNLNLEKYIKEMNILNKRGVTMRDVKTNKRNKIIGAVISTVVFSLFFVLMAGVIIYFQITEVEKCPWVLFALLMLMFIGPVIGAVTNLVLRIKEINGGEEDEASKY